MHCYIHSLLSIAIAAFVQISMSVSQKWPMTVIGMRTAGIPLAVITAVAGVGMRETASTAQVTQPCQSPLLYIDTSSDLSE